MTKGKREYLLRFADQALNDMERASSNLQSLAAQYGNTHPEHQSYCLTLVTALSKLYKLLSDFRKLKM